MGDLIKSIIALTSDASAYQCSPTSYAFLYGVLAITLITSVGGIYAWKKMFSSSGANKSASRRSKILAVTNSSNLSNQKGNHA